MELAHWNKAKTGLLTVIAAYLLALSAPVPAQAGWQRLHACAYRDQYSSRQLETLGGWDLLITSTDKPGYLAALRGHTRLLYYTDLIFAGTWLPGWEQVNRQESWFLHDRALGYRLFSADFGNYLMDPASGWGPWMVHAVTQRAALLGYQGVFTDDCAFTTRYLRLMLRSEREPVTAEQGRFTTRVRAEWVTGIYEDRKGQGRDWKQGGTVTPGPGDTTTVQLPPGAPRQLYVDYAVSVYRECEPSTLQGGIVRTRWPVEWVYGVWTNPQQSGTNLYRGKGDDGFTNTASGGAIAVASAEVAPGNTVYIKYKADFLPPGLEQRWQAGITALLHQAKRELGSKPLYYNGVDRRGGDSSFASVADGGMMEEAFHSSGVKANWFEPPERWKLFLDRIVSYQGQGKTILVQSGGSHQDDREDERVVMFCYASYLLGKGDLSSFNFAWEYDALFRPPAWSVDLGRPREPYRVLSDGLYSRKFERGRVLVRPPLGEGYRQGKAGTHTFQGRYRRLRLDGSLEPPAHEVTLEDATGVVLLPE